MKTTDQLARELREIHSIMTTANFWTKEDRKVYRSTVLECADRLTVLASIIRQLQEAEQGETGEMSPVRAV
jgi:hypothetical protein